METMQEVVRMTGTVIEFFGVLIIAAGGLIATIWFFFHVNSGGMSNAYQAYRRIFGRAVILGLDFLIAGDIIRTVIVSHTVTSVAVLAMIVVVRAFLSLTLELGIEGRFPWKVSHE